LEIVFQVLSKNINFFVFLKDNGKENKLPEAYVLILDPKIGKPMMFGLQKMQQALFGTR
jgi:hypothetical protein